MAAQKKREEVNLLPQEEFAASILGRVLTWLLTTFRVLVILTEVIVVAAFLSRFWLDAKSTDLNDEIKQKQAIIASYSSFEKDWNNLQRKITVLLPLTIKEKPISDLLSQIATFVPPEINLLAISISNKDEKVEIRGESFSEKPIAQFITNLSAINELSGVSLSQVVTQSSTQTIEFSLKAAYNKK